MMEKRNYRISTFGLTVAIIFACFAYADGLFFYLTRDADRHCFYEEVPVGTAILGTYKNPDLAELNSKRQKLGTLVNHPSPNTVGVVIEVRDPKQELLFKQIASDSGRFTFTSKLGGEHEVCFWTNTSQFEGDIRLHVKLDVGEEAIDYSAIAKKSHLSALELQIMKLIDRGQRPIV